MNILINKYIEYANNNKNEIIRKDPDKNNLRIMLFNVHLWSDCYNKSNFDQVFELIDDYNPDIVGLMEVVFNKYITNKIFKKTFGKKYKYIVMSNRTYGGNIIMSNRNILKFEILNLGRDNIKHENRNCIYVIVDNIKIVLTHLDVYDNTEQTRLKQIKKILSVYPKIDILMGDFNSLYKKDYDEEKWKEIVILDQKRNVSSQTLDIKKLN